jgi:Cu/Ag efflux protein CusF
MTVRVLLACACLLAIQPHLRAEGGQDAKDIRFFGRVMAVNSSEGTATVKHGNIPGFMDAMTMDYKISPKSELEKLRPGDDIRATAHAGETTLYNVTIVSRAKK